MMDLIIVATGLFLHIVHAQLVVGEAVTKYPWLSPQFYSDMFQTLFNRNYNSLEWSLNSPPKPHAFVSLPLQSTLSNFVLSEELSGTFEWMMENHEYIRHCTPMNQLGFESYVDYLRLKGNNLFEDFCNTKFMLKECTRLINEIDINNIPIDEHLQVYNEVNSMITHSQNTHNVINAFECVDPQQTVTSYEGENAQPVVTGIASLRSHNADNIRILDGHLQEIRSAFARNR